MIIINDEPIPGEVVLQHWKVQSIKPEEYMNKFLMDSVPRKQRKKMYQDMVFHGIHHWNDKLLEFGLEHLLLNIFKERELPTDDPDDVLEEWWSKEKEDELFDQVPIALSVIEDILISDHFYTGQRDPRFGDPPSEYKIERFPETWKLIIKTVSEWCWVIRSFGEDTGLYTEPNVKAFRLFCQLGSVELLKIALKKYSANVGYGGLHLLKARDEVIGNLRETLSEKNFSQVKYWLKYHGDIMPDDVKETFKVAYVKKGGEVVI
jgi:hypothetical protein